VVPSRRRLGDDALKKIGHTFRSPKGGKQKTQQKEKMVMKEVVLDGSRETSPAKNCSKTPNTHVQSWLRRNGCTMSVDSPREREQ
jgi:hypothetical protein